MRKYFCLVAFFVCLGLNLFTLAGRWGRCNCNQGCDALVLQKLTDDSSKEICPQRCSLYGGWNGNSSNADYGSPYCRSPEGESSFSGWGSEPESDGDQYDQPETDYDGDQDDQEQ